MKNQTVGKIGLVGPGAVGGYYGGLLAMSGQDIHFHFRSTYDSVHSNGLWLVHHGEGGRREPVDGLHAHSSTESIGVCDWVIVASKATANSILPDLIRPLVGDHTRLRTLQNGMGNAENLGNAFGYDRTILAGLCFTCINRTSPHVIESLLPGYVQFGELAKPLSEEGREMVQAFQSAGVRVRESESLDEALWRNFAGTFPLMDWPLPAAGLPPI